MPKAITGQVIIAIQKNNKEKYNLTPDVTIDIVRGHEFNRRLDYPSYGKIINGGGYPTGADCLFHHNSSEASYLLPEQQHFLSKQQMTEGYVAFSVPLDMVFCYKIGEEWQPAKDFLITKRIFRPYSGKMQNVPHEQVKNRLYVVNGKVRDEDEKDKGDYIDLSGKAVAVLPNADYEIIFYNKEKREETLVRTRNREVLAIDDSLTEEIKKSNVFLGNNLKDCKPLNAN